MAASGVPGPRDAKECAVTSEQLKRKDAPVERGGDGPSRREEEHTLNAWSPGASIRLAGYDDDPSESHIVRGID